jgi:prepilin-type N-terminal cleavage/methylation domain-containing protein
VTRGGFTLVEVLVVMVILTIGVLPLTMIQSRARSEVRETDRYTQAVTLAQQQLEWAKGQGFGNVVPDSGLVGHVAWRTDVQPVSFGLERIQVRVIFRQGSSPDTLSVAGLLSMR